MPAEKWHQIGIHEMVKTRVSLTETGLFISQKSQERL